MRRLGTILISLLTILALGGSILAANPRGVPHRYLPGSLDGGLERVTVADGGRTVAAWAYRSGAQYDIAISFTDEQGRWSEPLFFGENDGRDQIAPALTADGSGNLYLAFTDRTEGRVLLSWSRADAQFWSAPLALTAPASTVDSPAVRVVGDRLVVAFRLDGRITMIDLPLAGEGGLSLQGISDHPDPVEYVPGAGGDEPNADGDATDEEIIGGGTLPAEIGLPGPKKSQTSDTLR
jgi:hypothetical protein